MTDVLPGVTSPEMWPKTNQDYSELVAVILAIEVDISHRHET